MADFADRLPRIGYTGGSSLLLLCLLAALGCRYRSQGTILQSTTRQHAEVEAFYWAAITFSQTLGAALGDWMADSTGLGYEYGALVFSPAWR